MTVKKILASSICDAKFPIGSIVSFGGTPDKYLIMQIFNYLTGNGYELESFETGKHYVVPEWYVNEHIDV